MRYLRLTMAGVLTAAISLALLTFAYPFTRTAATAPNGAVEQRGLALPTWRMDGYQGSPTTQAISDIAALGATWIQLTPTWKMATATSSTIDARWTVADAGLRSAIDLAHRKHLKVLLKPHVDPQDGANRWQINPADRAAWFGSYQRMMIHYAALAQLMGVEEFSVGCELATMSGAADRGAWLKVINAIKAVTTAPLVYAAKVDEYRSVSFWDQLDFIGIDAYFPLSTRPTTDISALESAWIPIRDQMSAFAVGVGRRILFTEAGYPSLVGAAVEPWNNQYSATPSQQEQAAAYAALFATFSGQPWWAGTFWWSWWTDKGLYGPLDLAIGGKLAESVVRNQWGSTRVAGNPRAPWVECVKNSGSLPYSAIRQDIGTFPCQDRTTGKDE
ncbi:glycoside hydrolase family 113 [Mycobacterium cookii]|uniref:Glycoside hydrolase family 5 domain-containing protein n=1 Tax=Mycobacterium cookii TaxID=1775 RepID=A0A7I7KWB5_9MYCO|nr:hypothetical protein [Mycobacterium cookii]MCV7331811.1 hypothetical protein [Mycobacterium cookii]BBX46117.1 hypothetical protein MCOO_21320 [Mycobacterium cookii]